MIAIPALWWRCGDTQALCPSEEPEIEVRRGKINEAGDMRVGEHAEGARHGEVAALGFCAAGQLIGD
jgi:hypothetical protein